MKVLREIYNHVAFLAIIGLGLAFAYGLMTVPRTVIEAIAR